MASELGNGYSRQQTEEDLIRALNNLRANLVDLSKEVSRATQLREKLLKETKVGSTYRPEKFSTLAGRNAYDAGWRDAYAGMLPREKRAQDLLDAIRDLIDADKDKA